jgi:hypothetical protein
LPVFALVVGGVANLTSGDGKSDTGEGSGEGEGKIEGDGKGDVDGDGKGEGESEGEGKGEGNGSPTCRTVRGASGFRNERRVEGTLGGATGGGS